MSRVVGLFIGVSEFLPQTGLRPLPSAPVDVIRAHSVFHDHLFLDSSRSVILAGGSYADPTKDAVLDALESLSETPFAPDTDSLLVWCASHGFSYRDALYLVLSDTDGGTPAHQCSGSLLLEDLLQYLDQTEASQQLIVFDACREPLASPRSATRSRDAMPDDLGRQLASLLSDRPAPQRRPRRRVLMTGCGPGECSYEVPGVGGWFTHSLLDSLSRFPPGPLSVTEWYQSARVRMRQIASQPQDPMIRLETNDLPRLHLMTPPRSKGPISTDSSFVPRPATATASPNDLVVRLAQRFERMPIAQLTFFEARSLCQQLSRYDGPFAGAADYLLSQLVAQHYKQLDRRVPEALIPAPPGSISLTNEESAMIARLNLREQQQ